MAANSATIMDALPHNGPGKTDLIVEAVFLALDFIFTGVRLWSRRIQKTQLQANDILILIALTILTVRYAVVVVLVVQCGLGLHEDEVEKIAGPNRVVLFRKVCNTAILKVHVAVVTDSYEYKLTYVIDLMWLTLVTTIKVSILHFYTMIFRTKWFRYVVYGFMSFTVAFWIAAFFSDAFFCIPPQKAWLPDTPGHCGDASTIYIVLASTDLAIDIIVIALPMPILWGLQLAMAKKVSLTFIFGLGFIIIIITSVRIRFFSQLDPADITYTFSKIALLSSLVPLLGIINANLPLSAPVFQRVFSTSILSSTLKRSNRTGSTDNFQRLGDEEYRLTNIEGRPNPRSDIDPRGELSKFPLDSMCIANNLPVSREPNTSHDDGKINIRRDWEVNSTPALESHSNATYPEGRVLE